MAFGPYGYIALEHYVDAPNEEVRQSWLEGLKRYTQQDFGNDVQKWREWLDENSDRLEEITEEERKTLRVEHRDRILKLYGIDMLKDG